MPTKIWERLEKVAEGLHWLGKYEEANALWLTVRLMKAAEVETLEQWEAFVSALGLSKEKGKNLT